MHQGEIFAYPLYLHMELLKQSLEYFCQVSSCHNMSQYARVTMRHMIVAHFTSE